MPIRAALALVLSIAFTAMAQAPDSTWRQHRTAALIASGKGDTVGYRSHMLALQGLVGVTPRIAAGLAAASFALFDSAAGRHWSNLVTAMEGGSDVEHSVLAWRFDDADMIPEDLAYDAAHHRTLVSSVRRGSIVAVDARGNSTTFAAGGAPGTWGIFALGIDARRNTLWATTAAFPGTAGYTAADSGKSALLEYDLATGALRRRMVPPDGGAHVLGDLALAPDGTVYLSEAIGGTVYVLERGTSALRTLLPPGTFSSPQNPALSPDGRRLYVADYTFGIAVIELRSVRWHWLRHPDSLALTGIDGMYRVGTDLVVVQNGISPDRIMRLTLGANDQVLRGTTIVRGGAAVELNHAMLRRGQLYFIARSGWDRLSDDGTMKPAAKGDGPVVRRVSLTTHD